MRIALEAHELLVSNMSGVGRYVVELGRHLRAIDPESDFVLPLSRIGKHARLRKNGVRGARYVAPCWPFAAYDILHLTAGKSMRVAGDPAIVVTVHDFWEFHELERGERAGHTTTNQRLMNLLAIADGAICVSKSTQRDLHHFLPDLKIPTTVIHHGASAHFIRRTPQEITAFRARHLPRIDDYLLYVGHFHPRKNILGLVAGYAALARPRPPLVLAGNQHPALRQQVTDRARTLGVAEHELIQLDYLADADLPSLISGARGVVFVPLFEGFGLPLIEAYRCGTPVVCAANSSLIELAHPSSPLVEATSPEAIAYGIRALLDAPLDDRLRDELSAHGQSFSWARCARETRDFYQTLLARPRPGHSIN